MWSPSESVIVRRPTDMASSRTERIDVRAGNHVSTMSLSLRAGRVPKLASHDRGFEKDIENNEEAWRDLEEGCVRRTQV